VLEAPEERYASDSGGPRRVSAAPNRRLRRDLSEDFADPYEDDDVPVGRRGAGVRVRFRGLPATKAGRIFAGFVLLVCLAVGSAVFLMARSYLLHDDRFVIQSSASLEFEGNAHVTRAQLLGIFGEDVERNIFTVSLEQRRAEMERLPWVAHATVMRLLPNRMRVAIVERTPVAFVRQGSHIGLVDANGVLLDMPAGSKPVDQRSSEHYSFPVVTGISVNDPVSTRAARMKIFERFTSELDGSGEKISEELSEVDLSNPEDVQALIPDHSSEILVHFGEDNFLDRYRRFKEHLPEWHAAYPKLSSVDMRYERQVVLQMPPGSGIPATSSASAAAPDVDATVSKPAAKAPAAGMMHGAVESGEAGLRGVDGLHPSLPRGAKDGAPGHPGSPMKPAPKPVAKAPVHVTPQSEVAFAVPAKKSGAKTTQATPHAAAVKPHPIVVKHPASTTQYDPTQVVHP
jgi:cell division protein FtsQ